MAPFRNHPSDWQRLDWRLLQNGPVALYLRQTILDDDRAWLVEHGYRIYQLDATAWDVELFHRDVKSTLGFADYYGRNLDAFNDSLSDLDVPDEGGAVLEFQHFDTFARREPSLAHAILDIIATNARVFLLTGRRLLALVQTDDPKLSFDLVGASHATWNPREWLDEHRVR